MKELARRHLNLNTAFLSVLIFLLRWEGARLYSKVDADSSAIVLASASIVRMESHVSELDRRMNEMVTNAEFKSEVRRLEGEIQQLRQLLSQRHP